MVRSFHLEGNRTPAGRSPVHPHQAPGTDLSSREGQETPRQVRPEVRKLAAAGFPAPEIAEAMDLDPGRVADLVARSIPRRTTRDARAPT